MRYLFPVDITLHVYNVLGNVWAVLSVDNPSSKSLKYISIENTEHTAGSGILIYRSVII